MRWSLGMGFWILMVCSSFTLFAVCGLLGGKGKGKRCRGSLLMGVEFAIRIPGISFHIGKYVSEKNNVLRYVLKDRGTGEVYLVVCFTVVLEGEDAEDAEEGEEGRDEGDGVD